MTTDLMCLLVLALWSFVLNHGPAIARVQAGGMQWAASNRDTSPEVPAWVERADRAQRNHHDNLAMIGIVIVITALMGQGDDFTAIASILILVSRISHGVFYVLGIPLLRSLAYFGSVAGVGIIIWRLLV